MASTRHERRRRWFLRTWAASGWLAKWRAAVWAETTTPSLCFTSDDSPRARQWARFAADVRIPSGVRLEVRDRRTAVKVELPLTDPFLLVGNHPCCGLQLNSLLAKDVVYAFFWLHGELYGVDLRMNSPQTEPGPLQDGWWSSGQSLMLGDYTLCPRGLPGLPARGLPIEDQSTVTLHLDSPQGSQQRHLTRRLTIIGCAPDNGVMIHADSMAPRQAAFIRTPTSLWIVNLARGLPPKLGHQPVAWSPIDPLDEFTFGETKCHAVTTWPENFFALPPTLEIPQHVPAEEATDEYRARLLALHAQLGRMLDLSDSAS